MINQLNWIAMRDEWPPLGTHVLVVDAATIHPRIYQESLHPGDMAQGQDPACFYFELTSFDEVTHWAHMPPLPAPPQEQQ